MERGAALPSSLSRGRAGLFSVYPIPLGHLRMYVPQSFPQAKSQLLGFPHGLLSLNQLHSQGRSQKGDIWKNMHGCILQNRLLQFALHSDCQVITSKCRC